MNMAHYKRIEPRNGWNQGIRGSLNGYKEANRRRKPNRHGQGLSLEEQIVRIHMECVRLEKRIYSLASRGEDIRTMTQRLVRLRAQGAKKVRALNEQGRVIPYSHICRKLKREKGYA